VLALKVPDIPDVQAQYASAKRVLALQIASARDMASALSADSQISLGEAYASFSQAYNQGGDIHQAIESMLAKYRIPDAEVDYRFRDKA
jgi:hypothetical protein